ncbi:DUF5686 and carboxypeptidase regulatory-like domain-containing protein [Botryobacter ruber]|uniref:DUF5686 and carboxypeptidase regulatory-like domain-containing protein n=1 Tax=Botryobacter ruber TaxID=2171629 RepID=UPI000E0BBF0E|nr:DUF5686 and carboxypeptidase regulatory-like domain-containing protein [Botryobacter ruber]
MRLLWLLFLILFIPALAEAAVLSGRVTDEKGQGLPYASIYIVETASGSSTNESGYYKLQLSPGTYTIEFKYVGYKANVQRVTIADQAQQLNVSLEPEVLHLEEVVVRPSDEDPAYAIMRNAIKLRKYHQNEVNAWSARVYMKSLGRMEKVPSKILGVKIVDVDTGIVYLSESVSELHFKKPNKINERMISSRVSGQKKGFSFNQASEMNISFYDNLLKVEGLSERGFVSPLASNALFFYKFEYHGSFQESGRTIYKIKVIPRRRNDPVFSGFIYIVDGSWRIHSTDLKLTKNAGIDFVDFIRVQQVYAPVQKDVWMPVTQKFNFEASGLGFKGRGHVTGVYSRYKVQPAYTRPPVLEEPEPEPAEETATAEAPRRTRRQKPVVVEPEKADPERQQPIHEEGLFSKEILKIEEDANKRDSAYWAEIRPLPLTEEETRDYQKKDSLEVIKESREYKDSLDRIRNVPGFSSFFIRGYTYYNTYKDYRINVNPIVGLTGGNGILQFNTVEGWVTDVRVNYRRTLEDKRRYEIEPAVRYGFSNRKLNAKLKLGYNYDRFSNSSASVEGGRYVEDINNLNPIAPFANTASTLLYERNHLKLYQRDFVRINYAMDVVQSLRLNSYVDFSHRMPLRNTTSFKLRDLDERAFTPNVPVNEELPDAAFSEHQALTLYAALSWRPGQKYISLPDRKINLPSRWPTFTVAYRGAVKGVLGSDVQYNLGIAQISDRQSFGLFGTSEYSLTGGTFWGKGYMTLMDFKHFFGSRVIYAGSYQGFQLLDYYRYSTQNSYIEGHFEHHFNGFLFNKVPLFRRLKWQEVVTLNYLNTRESMNYLELGLGVEHIFKFLRVDFFSAFQQGQKSRTGIRFGFGF